MYIPNIIMHCLDGDSLSRTTDSYTDDGCLWKSLQKALPFVVPVKNTV